jgi:hypothetical protein
MAQELAEDIEDRVAPFRRRVGELFDQIEEWSKARGWQVEHEQMTIDEWRLGTYTMPTLLVRLNERTEFHVRPHSMDAPRGGIGCVDVSGFPAFTHVLLIGTEDGGWIIMTDSNFPLRMAWNAQTFDQLISDLTT